MEKTTTKTCVGNDDKGCGYSKETSLNEYVCPNCNGMLLTNDGLKEVECLIKKWKINYNNK